MTGDLCKAGMVQARADFFGVVIHANRQRMVLDWDELPCLIAVLLQTIPAEDLAAQRRLAYMLRKHAFNAVGIAMREMGDE